MLNSKFKCPECGGYKFGSSDCTSDNMKGHCHNDLPDGSRCLFTWDRNTEDEKYFEKVDDN